jgi:hypothetical protein
MWKGGSGQCPPLPLLEFPRCNRLQVGKRFRRRPRGELASGGAGDVAQLAMKLRDYCQYRRHRQLLGPPFRPAISSSGSSERYQPPSMDSCELWLWRAWDRDSLVCCRSGRPSRYTTYGLHSPGAILAASLPHPLSAGAQQSGATWNCI